MIRFGLIFFRFLICIFTLVLLWGCLESESSKAIGCAEKSVQNSPDSALKILRGIEYIYMTNAEKAKYCLLYSQIYELKLGQIPQMIEIADKYYDNQGTTKEKVLSKYLYGKYLWSKNLHKQAIYSLIDAEIMSIDLCDKVMQNKILKQIETLNRNNVVLAQNSYILEMERLHEEANARLGFQYYVILMILVVICGVATTFLFYITKQHKHDCEEAIFDLKECYKKETERGKNIINKLLKDNYKIFNGICGSLSLEEEDDEFNRKNLYREVKSIIKKFGSDKKCIEELERQVNACANDIMLKLREEVPYLSEIEYRQFCYHCVGFSGKLISMFNKESIKTVYSRKFRLKRKIEQSNCLSSLEFLN